ncbi:STAS-like domain-containing protein [Candidatus Woesearchaeota archaeon]|nr:STAS-like domain-containing protein [Candidatus Woesearchaeota archaeon]
MIDIKLMGLTGSFAENKDLAREVRLNTIIPGLEKKEEILLDFEGIEGATQSFIHALISDVLRKYGPGALDKLSFKNCNENVRKIITIVVDYMQES